MQNPGAYMSQIQEKANHVKVRAAKSEIVFLRKNA